MQCIHNTSATTPQLIPGTSPTERLDVSAHGRAHGGVHGRAHGTVHGREYGV